MSQPREFRGNSHRKMPEMNEWTKRRQEPALEPDLPIIDPHHHLWDSPERGGRYLMHELAEDTATGGHNIVATVFIDAGVMYRAEGPDDMKAVGEVEFVNGVAAMSASGKYGRTRHCAGIIGHVDMMLGERAKPVLEAEIKAGNGRYRGIRHGAVWDTGEAAKFGRRHQPRYQMLDPQFRKGFACLQPLGLSFEAWVFHPQLDDVAGLLKQFPDTNVILNHVGGLLGIPPHENRKETFEVWKRQILKLVPCKNLSVKLGGLGMVHCGWDFHLRDMPPSSEELAKEWWPYIETCIEAFGVERCMMESNFPVDKQSCGYGVLWNALKRITAKASAAEKKALYHDTAARVYRLPY
jgi:predicted TIM-barrel fold metal-dependent hydrolase